MEKLMKTESKILNDINSIKLEIMSERDKDKKELLKTKIKELKLELVRE